jgi:hypothetical protein
LEALVLAEKDQISSQFDVSNIRTIHEASRKKQTALKNAGRFSGLKMRGISPRYDF